METLNEVALEFAKDHHNMYETSNLASMYFGFICGAKWQQERSYSEEEVEYIMAETWILCVGNDGNNFKKVRNKILKQFKNK